MTKMIATLGTLACSAACVATASAAHQTVTANQRVRSVHVAFHRSRSDVRSLIADGRYVFLQSTSNSSVLIDDATGQQTPAPAGCGGPVLGGPWLLFTGAIGTDPSCLGTLYPVAGGTPRQLQFGGPLGAGPIGSQPAAIGDQWIETDINCDDVHFCASWHFENLQTGAVRSNPTSRTSIPDLDSARLSRRVCSPLRVPVNHSIPPTALLRQAGRFVLAATPADQFLEKCGTHLRQRLVGSGSNPVALTSKAVLWQTAPRTLSGLQLPSLRRFQIRLPINASFGVAIGPRTMYAVGDDQLWTSPVPRILAGATTHDGCSGPSACFN